MNFSNNPVVLFDGICNLCNQSVQFIINHNKKGNILFASQQSDIGKRLLEAYHLPQENINSFVFIYQGKAYLKSTAALEVAKHLDGGWRYLSLFMLVPKFIRDGVYSLIANNRYRWFGKSDACFMPSAALQVRFLSNDMEIIK
jgi:predicted DCC family thiol-disulfide oxidoreductase YuxK